MNRNTYLSSQYTVPSLSLASSRSKRTVPTKDTIQIPRPVQHKSRAQIMDRINRPSIFSTKSIADSKISIESSSSQTLQHQKSTQSIGSVPENLNLNRNVYLQQVERQIEKNQSTVTFRAMNTQQVMPPKPPSSTSTSTTTNYLRNPQSHQIASHEIQRRLQEKKVDINKSLFDRKIKKLFQQAQFYDNELMGMYADNSEILNKQLIELQKCRKDALTFNFGSALLI